MSDDNVLKTYKITPLNGEPIEARAESVAWTENGEFILLMDGDDVKHVVVATSVVSVTEV